MADPSNLPENRPPAAPRWVKVFAIVIAVVVVLLVVVALASGGEHGPGRHSLGNKTSLQQYSL